MIGDSTLDWYLAYICDFFYACVFTFWIIACFLIIDRYLAMIFGIRLRGSDCV